jgi:carbon-monoxide dehydrogenase medium subunit
LLDGSVLVRSARSQREIPARDFFVAPYTTALEPRELVIETHWPAPRKGWGYAFCEFAQRHGDYALCMAAAAVSTHEVRVVVGAVTERPLPLEVDPAHPGASAAAQVEPWGTVHASSAYLKQLVGVLVDRAVLNARARAAR